jgi:hypothetical protein
MAKTPSWAATAIASPTVDPLPDLVRQHEAQSGFTERQRASRPAVGADRTGAPDVAELARAERAATLSFLPRRRAWRGSRCSSATLPNCSARITRRSSRFGNCRRLGNEPNRHSEEVAQWALAGRKGETPTSRRESLQGDLSAAEGVRDGLTVAIDRKLQEHADHIERNRDRMAKSAKSRTFWTHRTD